ncbi:MAG: DUF4276 family protein [Azoarcus sp.]|jgi:hypothetical protein|nr:DUF4276 family protein [Azoarcus sp.]
MIRLKILVEGPSEEVFVKQVLAPHLKQHKVNVTPVIIVTKKRVDGYEHRGGGLSWKKVLEHLRYLANDSDAISTLFDFYGLPKKFPGYREACAEQNPRNGVEVLEERLAQEFKHPNFIPFFALHEFETWLFSDPDTVATYFGEPVLANELRKAVQGAVEPEFINHGIKTHPKKRLDDMLDKLSLAYKETSDGPILMSNIGISTVRSACPHFSGWLDRLEQLGKMAI